MKSPIDGDELQARLLNGPALVVLDVRSAWEYRRGHIPGARHVPFWQPWKFTSACHATDNEVVVACGQGPRAWMVAAVLHLRGIARPRLLRGHMRDWRARGRPLER